MHFQQITLLALLVVAAVIEIAHASELGLFSVDCEKLPNGKYTNIRNCRGYIQCKDGIKSGQQCLPTTKMWSTKMKRCVFTNFPSCSSMRKHCPKLPNGKTVNTRYFSYMNKSEESLRPDSSFVCSELNEIYPVEDNQHSYRVCVDGQAFIGQCPDKSLFDPESRKCSESLFQMSLIEGDADCRSGDGIYGYLLDCTRFQVCCGRKSFMYSCPTDQGFDMNTLTCKPASDFVQPTDPDADPIAKCKTTL